jgi:hypothetical protein
VPATNADRGFLMKDIFLLGATIWTAGEALRSVRGGSKNVCRVHKVA